MNRYNESYKGIALSLCIVFIAMFVCLSFVTPTYAVANATSTFILDELNSASTFDEQAYRERAEADKDKSYLEVITIAESLQNDLYVYVFQPNGKNDMLATELRLSADEYQDVDYSDYNLKYISSCDCFFKYKVEDFKVSDAQKRVYNVVCIFRAFDESLGDKPASLGQEIDYVEYPVSMQFIFETLENGNVSMSSVYLETIQISEKFVGFVRYPSGYIFHEESCDSHFVAFDTLQPIDQLVEAKVSFVQQAYVYTPNYGRDNPNFYEKFDESELQTVVLKATDTTVSYEGGGLLGSKYTWRRIQTVDEFISSVNVEKEVYCGAVLSVNSASKINEEAMQELEKNKWVLRFAETDYEVQKRETLILGNRVSWDEARTTLIGEVTILQLKFWHDGTFYNLGVIDNKVTGSGEPINDIEYEVGFNGILPKIFKGIAQSFDDFIGVLKIMGIVIASIILFVIIVKLISMIVGALRKNQKDNSRPRHKKNKKKINK